MRMAKRCVGLCCRVCYCVGLHGWLVVVFDCLIGLQGHLLCRVPFEATSNLIYASLEYVMEPKSAADGGGQGLCIYLCDPSVEGWDRHFDGSGPLGFVGKKGAIVGVGIDCTGSFCEGQPSSVAIKRASDSKLLCDPVCLEGGVVTRKDDFWRKVKIRFDIEENTCDVTIGGVKVLDDVKFEGVKIPRTVCVGVCAGTADGHSNHICVNALCLEEDDVDSDDEQQEEQAQAPEVASEVKDEATEDSGTGIPEGCTDWKVENRKLVPSEQEENWRTAGNTVCKFGFELTQDQDNQEVLLMSGHFECGWGLVFE